MKQVTRFLEKNYSFFASESIMRLFKKIISPFFLNFSGFTLIELVIVIAIIAIIATGVIAALNPIEQKNRGDDVKTLNTMSEFLTAINRWTSVNGYYPFCTDISQTSCVDNVPYFLDLSTDQPGGAGNNMIQKLIGQKEITQNFATQTLADQMRIAVSYANSTKKVTLCFMPKSQQQVSNISGTLYCTNTSSGIGNTVCSNMYLNAGRTYPGTTTPPRSDKNLCISG